MPPEEVDTLRAELALYKADHDCTERSEFRFCICGDRNAVFYARLYTTVGCLPALYPLFLRTAAVLVDLYLALCQAKSQV
jgi:hypothetical protein